MNTLRQRIEDLEAQIAQLRAEEAMSFPRIGDKYYYTTSDGDIASIEFDDRPIDHGRAEIGNLYENKKDAELSVERLKILTELRKLSIAAGECDWDDFSTNKYVLYFSYRFMKWEIAIANAARDMYAVYFPTKAAALSALETVGDRRLMLLLK